jgi:hypothetical protein
MDTNLIATLLMTVGLTGGAALALWQLPWSEKDLREMNQDARAARQRLGAAMSARERRVRVAA